MARLANQLPGEMTANLFFKRYYRLRGLEKRYGSGFETDAWLTGMRTPAR